MVERLRGLGPAGRHGPDVPRPRPQPAPLLLAAPARRRAAAGAARLEAAVPGPDRPPAARPLPVHAGQGPRRRDRVGEEPADRAARLRARPPRRRRREPPIPVDLFVRAFADYERAKARAGRIDFDDLLTETIDLLETRRRGGGDHPGPQALVQRRRVPGHEPAPGAPARAVGGRVARMSASSATRTRRSTRSPARRRPTSRRSPTPPGARVVALTENYRSTPEVLDLANRLLWSAGRPKRLSATRPAGPGPTITPPRDGRRGARLARRADPGAASPAARRPPRSRSSSGRTPSSSRSRRR